MSQAIRMGNPLKTDLVGVFFSLPLARAKEISARVAGAVTTQASGGRQTWMREGMKFSVTVSHTNFSACP